MYFVKATIFIFKERLNDESIITYCDYDKGELNDSCNLFCYNVMPATKEQRDLLFKKMKEIGYMLDADKKDKYKANFKDGDILVGGDWVFIFRKFHINGFPKCHCHYDLTLDEFKVDADSYMACGGDIYSATKEQCNLLFQKMKEAGYEWNDEKKELKKVEQEELSDFEKSLKHMMEETIECGDTHNLKADAEILLGMARKQVNPTWNEDDERTIKEIDEIIYECPYCESKEEISNWLKSLKERIGG